MGPHGGLRFAQPSTDEHCVLRAAATCLHPPAIGTADAMSAGPLFTSGNTSGQVVGVIFATKFVPVNMRGRASPTMQHVPQH